MDIIALYEDLRNHLENEEEFDDLFYNAPEGHAQVDIVIEMLNRILDMLNKI